MTVSLHIQVAGYASNYIRKVVTVADCSYIITLSKTWNPFYTLWQISELGYSSITHQKVTFPVVTAMGTSNLTLQAYCFSMYDAFAHK